MQHFLFKPFSDGLDVWNGCIVFLVYNFCQYRNKNKFEAGGSKIDITVC
ncbi:hypothetical protein NEIELOOT_00824 [Neisseria elongata subsp. glycolytica ATCC 29315]|uniref:Uncharacterized protein n=1 Tax=Neisseria elongata subsp. glycolytica ATCC 29315 TaxID=546263 RepID=D4DP39_NEIEG|nr:hypothetical protein NEIELOOT_00824 [Neisseria elongata subsp. glycolytica ATCC 29315]